MAIVKNIINHKFGKLLVIKQLEERGNKGQIKYECVCDCGNSHKVTGESLRSGKSKSCGCNRKTPPNKIKDRESAIWKYLYQSTVVKRNKSKGFNCDIQLEDFISMSKKECHYCGLLNSNKAQDRRGWNKNKQVSETVVLFNGIDRLDSKLPYTKKNCVTCCKYCNTAKNIMSKKEFLNFIKRVYEYNHRNSV